MSTCWKWLLISALLALTFLLASCNWFNQSPIAQISVSTTSGEAPLTINFDGTSSYDPDDSISHYDWSFGDGDYAYGATASHTYEDDGSFTVTLTVTDNNGATDNDSVTVTVTNPSPIADFTYSPSSPLVRETVTFDASYSNDPASMIKPEYITNFSWDFGDGSSGNGVTVDHIYNSPGTYDVTLSVTDDDGATRSVTQSIVVSEPGPPYYYPKFEWRWDDRTWTWQPGISKDLYWYFRGLDHHGTDYGQYVLNPADDEIMQQLTELLSEGIGNYYDKLINALYFVQAGIQYDDYESPPEAENLPNPHHCYDCEWVRYPIETLAEKTGDCEDTAILYAAIARTFGHGAKLRGVVYRKEGKQIRHLVAAVPVATTWFKNHVYCDPGYNVVAWYYPDSPDITWVVAETAVIKGYLKLGCAWYEYEDLTDNVWDVSSASWLPPEKVRQAIPLDNNRG